MEGIKQIEKAGKGEVNKFVLYLLVLTFSILYAPTTTEDQDVWFHLRYGEHFIQDLTWDIDHTLYSWTDTNGNWKYVSWIGSSLFYLTYQVGSIGGLYILHWLLLAMAAILFLSHWKRSNLPVGIFPASLLMLTSLAILPSLSAVKPEVLTLLFFASTLYIHFEVKRGGNNRYYLYPLIFLIWVNSHGGFIVGLILLALLLMGEAGEALLKRDWGKRSPLIVQLGIYSFFSLAVSCINPEGPAYIMEILGRRTGEGDYTSALQNLFAYHSQWPYLWPGNYSMSGHKFVVAAWVIIGMAGSIIYMLTRNFKEKGVFNLSSIPALIFFFWLAMKMGRGSIYFPILWMFSYSSPSGVIEKPSGEGFKRILLLVGAVNVLFVSIFLNDFNHWMGEGMDKRLPLKEAEFIKAARLPGPILNDYLTGGYLLWKLYPDYKVFIDPRYGPYAGNVAKDWFDLEDKLTQETLAVFSRKYPFKTAILDTRWLYQIYWLISSPEWKLFYIGENAVIIVQRDYSVIESREEIGKRLAPERFLSLNDPVRLSRLFDIYLNIWPSEAEKILAYYRSNVSGFYLPKRSDVLKMENALKQKLQLEKNRG